MFNLIRRIGWNTVNMIKSDSINKRLKEIKKVMADDVYYNNYIVKKIDDLLNYASNNTEFYSKYRGYKISDYPVINKTVIIDNYDSFKSFEYKDKNNIIMSTSGSTGIPFKIEQDFFKKKQVLAEVLYYSNKIGYKVGNKLIYLRNLESGFKKSKFKKILQNEELIFTRNYNDENISRIINKIKKSGKCVTILGYASTLGVLSSYMQKHNIFLNNLNGIISGAEAITNKTRKITSQHFGCPVVSRYSNQEMGIFAQDYEIDHFELNRASYYFELLSLHDDNPVKNGEIGRIVVTDLYNHAMPLIRYDTGDLGIIETNENGKVYLSKVYGRKLDLLYTTNNEPISFFAFDDYFENNDDVEQFQIIQEDRTNLILNLITKSKNKVDEEYYITNIKKIMGGDCNVKICYLKQLPITNSGKFRYVISKYKPED